MVFVVAFVQKYTFMLWLHFSFPSCKRVCVCVPLMRRSFPHTPSDVCQHECEKLWKIYNRYKKQRRAATTGRRSLLNCFRKLFGGMKSRRNKYFSLVNFSRRLTFAFGAIFVFLSCVLTDYISHEWVWFSRLRAHTYRTQRNEYVCNKISVFRAEF